MDTVKTKGNQAKKTFFPVVGIGTSASDLEVLKKILADLTPDSGMAYIIFENLAVEQHQNLSEILFEHSKLPLEEIINTVELHANHVYIIPRSNFLILENGLLKLQPSTRSNKTANSLDHFFEVLAQKYQSYAIGLLLHYSSTDGVYGLKKIKESGGAAVSALTKSSFLLNNKNSEFIDYFTRPEFVAQQLLEIKNSYEINRAYDDDQITQFDETTFYTIIEVISQKSGTNFHQYNHPILRRRIAKRMVLTQQKSPEKYLNFLKNSIQEQDHLFNDFLITVSYFCTDPQLFDNLQKNIFPSIAESIDTNEIRIWSAGCATGEEVYTLAIYLDEYLQNFKKNNFEIKIFASDLSQKCIEKARSGIYTLQELKNCNEERLSKYFTKRENGYHINKIIRDKCVFAVHDLTKDFPFSKIDLIVCRNVLMYFNNEMQQQVLSSFHYALKQNGFLFLGKSDILTDSQNLFTEVDKNEKIYARNSTELRLVPNKVLTAANLSEDQRLYFKRLQIVNEELVRQTNELLSKNEELLCTNDELKNRRNELSSMRNQLESIIQTIKEPLIIIDQNFIVQSANPAFYSYFRTEEQMTEGFSIFELGNSQWNAPEIKELVLNKIRHDEKVENVKVEFNLGNSRKKIMLINATPIVDSIPAGIMLIALEDITELEFSNEILRGKNAELESHTKELESFTLVASDNLLEPIRKIYMFGKKVADNEKGLSESGDHNLKRLLTTAVNMNQLIEDLINFSKINFTEKKLKKTDLNLIIKKVINDLRITINERKAIIIADPLPVMNIIPWQMHLLFMHLISNAIKYSKQDLEPQIKIEVASADHDYIKLSVTDNGKGFSQDFETLIFNPFFKLDSNDKEYGTGLGLTLVQKIVENHKGFIKASSEPGEGTVISVYIPKETFVIEN